MSFDSFGAFLAMGGHGLYVWLAYGSTVLVIGANVVSVRRERRRFFAEARSLQRRQRAHGAGAPGAPGAGRDRPGAGCGSAPGSGPVTGAQTGKPVGN